MKKKYALLKIIVLSIFVFLFGALHLHSFNNDEYLDLKNNNANTTTVLEVDIKEEIIKEDSSIDNFNEEKININTASIKELTKLNGIGDTIASSIIEYRDTNNGFKTIDEIKKVKRIGEKTFNKIKDFITVK